MYSCGNRYKSMERSLIIMKLLLYKIVTPVHSQHSHPSAQLGGDVYSCGNRYKSVEEAVTIQHSHPSAQSGVGMYSCGNMYKSVEKSLIVRKPSL